MAGSWTRLENVGKKDSANEYYGIVGMHYSFTADASDGTIPDLTITSAILQTLPGADFIFGIDVQFDGTTPPNELTVVQKTANGNTQWSPTKLAASGFSKPDSPEPVASGFKLGAAQTAAATVSAKGTVTIYLG